MYTDTPNRKERQTFFSIVKISRQKKIFEKVLTPTLRNSLEYVYREEGKANDDSE